MSEIKLSDSQKAAVYAPDTANLVLAGPGSGKTAVLIERVNFLINEYHANPANILVITFTKASAEEMKDRFCKKCGGLMKPVSFGTFHAVFYTILKNAYGNRVGNIIPDEMRNELIKEIIAKKKPEDLDDSEVLKEISSAISRIKNSVNPEEAEDAYKADYLEYERLLRKNRYIDFDDMLMMTYELLTKREDHLKAWQEKFKWILIDEAQDINPIQYEIVKLLAKPGDNIFMVGDDDQSIYGFRGSDFALLDAFLKDYCGGKPIVLEDNFRSYSEISKKALSLISNNNDRFEKTFRNARGAGAVVEREVFPDIYSENRNIIERIKLRNSAGVPFEDMAVIFRTNFQCISLIYALLKEGIPFSSKEHTPNIYEHRIARDIESYIRLSSGEAHRKDVLNIMNKPLRYLSRSELDSEIVDFEEWAERYEDREYIAERIHDLSFNIGLMADMKPYAAINYIRKGIGYDDYLRTYDAEHSLNFDYESEILDTLMENAKNADCLEDYLKRAEELIQVTKEQNKKSTNAKGNEGVKLMTFHSSKGLEFDTVFIPQLMEGAMPHVRALSDKAIEEERRLLYVGMTRAKNALYLSASHKGKKRLSLISRFWDEIKD
ncbi:MAG: ATP-dependent helicase [Lachnospiraceae bacterium]|nr:ATP-dependent helicase [Lachnospiraceae bacterium]